MVERSRKARSRVDYAALEAGLADNHNENEHAEGSDRGGDNVDLDNDVVVDLGGSGRT